MGCSPHPPSRAGPLPSMATSVFRTMAGGYRLGVGGLELEGRVKFNYLLLALAFEFLGKVPVLSGERFNSRSFSDQASS